MEYLAAIKGINIFSQILQDLAYGAEFKDIFLKHVGYDLTQFQNNWESWVKNLELKNIPGIKTLTTEFKNRKGPENKEYTELESRRSRDFTYLGDILKSRDHFKAAIIEYKKALSESPSHSPVLFNKLARTYLQTRKYNEAENLLKESLAFFPDFHTSLANMGEVYFSKENYKISKVYFEKAIRINPFNPILHMRLIHVYTKLGLTKEKELQAQQFSYID